MQDVNRMCVSCRKRLPKSQLNRIAKNGESPIIDNKKKQTSRAIYVCKNEKCIEILKKSNAISRLLKVSADEKFYNDLKN